MTQFARPDENMRRDLQSKPRDRVASVVVDCSQQTAQLLGFKDRCIVLGTGSDESALEHTCRIGRAAGCGDGVTKNPSSERTTLLGRLVLAGCLKPLKRRQDFKRLDILDGAVADCGNQLFEEVIGLDEGRIGPAVLHHHLFDVLARDSFERLRGQELLADLLLALLECWVAA